MSFNYKNVKFAVDHLTFKKVINSILEILTTIKNKITNLSESIGEQIFSNNVLVLDESNWDQYITPRPKIVGLDGDNITDYSIANNPFNQETCYYIAIERDTYLTDDTLTEDNIKKNYGKHFIFFIVEPDNTDDSFNNNSGALNFFEDFKVCTDNSEIKSAIDKKKFIKIARARLKVPKKYKTVQFNFKYISFLGLTIVPEGFIENLDDIDSEENKNKQLNGTELNIFQPSTSGIDISSFRSPKTSDGELFIKERVVSLNNSESRLGAFKNGAKIIDENGEDPDGYKSMTLNTYNNKIKITASTDGTVTLDTNKTTSKTDVETIKNNLPTKLITYPNWGGVTESVCPNLEYNTTTGGRFTTTNFTSFDNLIQFHSYTASEYCTKHEEISGTYVNNEECLNYSGLDDTKNNYPFPSSGSLKRLKPGRETKLIWYNGFWFYC